VMALLAPFPALAQVEALAYSRARAQCGYDYQEQARLRCPGGQSACTAPLLTRQQSCLHRAEQAYVRDLRRQFRPRDY
jgi:hypothetical protein